MTQNALELINRAITSLDAAAPEVHPSRARVREELVEMQRQVREGNVPERSARTPGLARLVADSWPVDSQAGSDVITAELAYLALP